MFWIKTWRCRASCEFNCEGPVYHLMSRGDRREPIFLDEKDRQQFLLTLGQTCCKTGARTIPFGASRAEWEAMSPAQRWELNDGAVRMRIGEGDNFRYIGQDPFLQRKESASISQVPSFCVSK